MHGSHQDVLAPQQLVESGWLEDVYQILSPFTHLNIASNKVSSSVERTDFNIINRNMTVSRGWLSLLRYQCLLRYQPIQCHIAH